MNPVEIVCRRCNKAAVVSHYRATVKKHMRCNECIAEDDRALRARRKAEGRPIPRSKERAAEYAAKYVRKPESPAALARRAADMRRYTADPVLRVRHEARWKVHRAVASGALVRQPCEKCGATPSHGHHDDYSKPLEVRWLCRAHHYEWHRQNTPRYPAQEVDRG